MTKNNVPVGLTQAEDKGYSPEQFGLTQEFVYRCRQQLFATKLLLEQGLVKESDGLFLYARSLLADTSGKENGGYYFGEVAITPEYHAAVSAAEEYIFKHHPSLGSYIVARKNLIELGHGLGQANKVKHVIDTYCLDPDRTYTHYGFDVAGSVAEKLPHEYDTQSHIRGEGVTSNWFDTNLFQEIDDKCYLILGGSIGNYEDADVVRLLSRLTSDSLYTGRPIIVSHFLAPQEPNKKQKIDAICAGYKTAQVETFIMKGFASLGLDTSAMQLAVVYEEARDGQPARVKVGAKLLKSMRVDIGNGKTAFKRAGEHIWAISSRRYATQQFEYMAKQAGCSIKHTASYGHMGVSVLMSKRKPLPTRLKYAAVGLASLLAAFQGGMYFNQWLQIKTKQKQIQELKVSGLTNNFRSDYYNISLQQVLLYHDKEMSEFITLLQHRYGVTLNTDQTLRIQALFIDRVRNRGFDVSSYVVGRGQQMSYDPYLLYPHELDKFVRDCKTSLAAEGIPIRPNSRLTIHRDAVLNTYNYQGQYREFSKVDELPDYAGYTLGTYEDGTLDLWRVPTGLVNRQGKLYMVFQLTRGGPYVLQPRPESLYRYDFSAQRYVIDIIGEGQVLLLAEQIRELLNEKYGKGFTYALNGQAQIVSYIMGMYAAGYDLSYLVNSGVYDSYHNKKELLDVFVLGYVIPDIGETLRLGVGGEKMYDINWRVIDSAAQSAPAIRDLVHKVEHYMQRYVSLYDTQYDSGFSRPLILQYLMADRAWRFLDNDQDIRCRLLEHHDDFTQHGLELPYFPDRVEALTDRMKIDAGKHIVVAADAAGIEQMYSSMIRNKGYVFANGDIATLVHYQHSWKVRKPSMVLAKVVSTAVKDQLRAEYQLGLHGKLSTSVGRGASLPVTDRNQIISMLIGQLPYSTDPLERILEDYADLKAAWKAYQDKKK